VRGIKENATESQLQHFRLSDIPFYPTCHVVPQRADGMFHSEGLNSIQTAAACVERKGGGGRPLQTYFLLYRRWRDLQLKKRMEAEKKIQITDLFKKYAL
jgi:hypothetical protein